MTAQFNDSFRYRGEEFAVAGISEGELFDISLLDLKPVMACTACYRGYVAQFGVAGAKLVIATLQVNLMRDSGNSKCEPEAGPVINAITPIFDRERDSLFSNQYDNLNYHLEYTGGVLLANGFIEEVYVHMGFHPAWKYNHVIELIFEAGILKGEFDRSAQMSELRLRFTESRGERGSPEPPSDQEITAFIERAFDRRY